MRQRVWTWLLLLSAMLTMPGLTEAQQLGGRMHQSNMRLNKLRAGTLANCGANNFVSGFRTDGTAICATLSLATLTDGGSVVTLTGVQRVRNKQNIARVTPLTINTGPPQNTTPNLDTTDIGTLDAIPADLTINAPIGTGGNPEPEQELEFRFLCATPRAFTWHAIYTAENGIPLPTSCTGNGVTYDRIKFRFNATSGKFGLIATTIGVAKGVTTLASSTTYAVNADIATDAEMQMTGATGTVTIAQPTGTPVNGQKLLLRLMCTNTQTVAWHIIFIASPNVPLPTSCAAGTTRWNMYGVIYSTTLTKWQLMAVN